MKKLLLFLILLAGCVNAATYDITKTIPGDYATLAIAEAAWDIDLVSGDSSITYNITAAAVEGQTYISGATSSATSFITVTTSGTARHSGTYSTSAWRIETTSGGEAMWIPDDFVTLDGLQIYVTTNNGLKPENNEGTIIKNCIVRGDAIDGDADRGFYAAGLLNASLWNNIVYNFSIAGIYLTSSSGSNLCYNNTVVDCAKGITGGYKNVIAINNIIYGCTSQSNDDIGEATNNATDLSSITYSDCGGCGANDIYSMADPFVNYASDNFLLDDGTSDPAEGGTSLSGVFTDDILGVSRPQSTSWDIGAHEYPVAATSSGWIMIIE